MQLTHGAQPEPASLPRTMAPMPSNPWPRVAQYVGLGVAATTLLGKRRHLRTVAGVLSSPAPPGGSRDDGVSPVGGAGQAIRL